MHLNYTAPPTIAKFMQDDKSFVRTVVGPLGSGKTTGMGMELFRRAVAQAPDGSGERPTRFCCIRNTLQQLRQTVLPEIRTWFGPVLDFKVFESTCRFEFPLPDGSRVMSEWLLMPLDTPDDIRRVLSLNLTGVWFSELREINYEVFQGVLGRVGRYPSRARVAPTWEGAIAETNPWSEGSEYHEHFVLDLPKNWSLYRQPGGLDAQAENRANLPPDYYERLMEGHDEEWIEVYVHSQWGLDKSGQAVFRRSFKKNLHVAPALVPNRMRPLMIAQDLGRTPTCLITQVDAMGRLLVFDELVSDDMGLMQFIGEMVLPLIRSERYQQCSFFAVIDPSGTFKSQLREENAVDIFRRYGIPCYPAMTNDLAPRLQAVETLFLSLRGAGPAILIDGPECPLLLRALAHDYRYKRRKTGDLEDIPEKNHPASDLVDALQYAALSVQQDLSNRHSMFMNRAAPRAQPSAMGWT